MGRDAPRDAVIAAAAALPAVRRLMEGRVVGKQIYVPGKIVNFVLA